MTQPASDLFRLSLEKSVLVVAVAADQLTAVESTDRFDEELRALLDSRPEKLWVVDFQSVTFMVTPAVNTLLVAAKRLKAAGGDLVLTGFNKNIRQIFALMLLDQVLSIAPDVKAAVKSLAAA